MSNITLWHFGFTPNRSAKWNTRFGNGSPKFYVKDQIKNGLRKLSFFFFFWDKVAEKREWAFWVQSTRIAFSGGLKNERKSETSFIVIFLYTPTSWMLDLRFLFFDPILVFSFSSSLFQVSIYWNMDIQGF